MIQPGLERISLLLKDVHFPWKAIHVAGTNGKGSVCGYAAALLTRRHVRNGRFTSPHIINRWDCIAVDEKPVSEQEFKKVETHFMQLNQREAIGASEFELLTATAFQLFNDKKVQIGVIEVGMGGRLDATNILNNQAVSVISKIAADHQNFLGNTLEEIALHKAGILRPNVPYVVNPINTPSVQQVIDRYAKEIGAGPRIYLDTPELAEDLYKTQNWTKFSTPLRPFQRDNAMLAYMSFLEVYKALGFNSIPRKTSEFLPPLKNRTFEGRLSMQHSVLLFGAHRRPFLVDGAHNTDAAEELKDFVKYNLRNRESTRTGVKPPTRGWPITWVIAMTDGKDAYQFLKTLLKPGDKVVTTTFDPVDGMPWVKPMDPEALAKIATQVHLDIRSIAMPQRGTFRAVCAAKYMSSHEAPIVLTGSLYLVGNFLRDKQQALADPMSIDIRAIDLEENQRIAKFLGKSIKSTDSVIRKLPTADGGTMTLKLRDDQGDGKSSGNKTRKRRDSEADEKRKLQEEIDSLSKEVKALDGEYGQLSPQDSPQAANSGKASELPHNKTRPVQAQSASQIQRGKGDFADANGSSFASRVKIRDVLARKVL